MQITAQKRSIWNKLQESTNLGGIAAETIFNPEFQEIMDELRDNTDDPIRDIIGGQGDGLSCKELLKSARSNFNRREYMKTVGDLGRFHKKIDDVVNILNSFAFNLDKVHHRFLFDELDPSRSEYNKEYAEYLHNLKERFAPKKANFESKIKKQAGVLDFLKNITTERGRALAAWEKKYPSKVKELKKETLKLLDASDKLLATILSQLKRMAVARAKRQVDDYVKEGSKIVSLFKVYDDNFRKYYDSQISGFLNKQELLKPETTKSEEILTEPSITPEKSEIIPAIIENKEIIKEPAKENISEVIQPTSTSKVDELIQKSEPAINTQLEEVKKEIATKPKTRGKIRNQPVKPPSETKIESPAVKITEPTVVKPSVEIKNKPDLPPIEITTTKPITGISPTVDVAPEQSRQVAPMSSKQMDIINKALQRAKQPAPIAQPKIEPAQVPTQSTEDMPDVTDPELREMLNLKPLPATKSNIKFIESLESLSNEDPIVLGRFISKYADSIKQSNPNMYDNLISIVKSIGTK